MSLTFKIKVYEMSDESFKYYDLTEKELEEKCSIFADAACIFWKTDVDAWWDANPDQMSAVYEKSVTLKDIWWYESTEWWDWKDEQREVMFNRVPHAKYQPFPQRW